MRVFVRVDAHTHAVAKTVRRDEQQLRLFEDETLDSGALDSLPGSGASTEPDAATPHGSTVRDQAGTVSFVGPDGDVVPVDALRRIVGLMIDQARRSPEVEAS